MRFRKAREGTGTPRRRESDHKLFARYGRRREDNKWPRHLRDFVLVVVIGLWLFSLHSQNSTLADLRHDERSVASQHLSLVEACNRLQIQRIEDNISHYADYKVDLFVLRASEHPLQGQTPQQRKFTIGFLLPLRQAVAAKTWTPRTGCEQAVDNHGVAYRPPQPIPFYVRKPPLSAVSLEPADFR